MTGSVSDELDERRPLSDGGIGRQLVENGTEFPNHIDVAALVTSADEIGLPNASALEYRDRGILHQQLGCPEAAVADFERFIELVPQHRSAGAIREALPQLRRMRSSVH